MAQSLNGHLSTRVISLACQSLTIEVPLYMYGMDPDPETINFRN